MQDSKGHDVYISFKKIDESTVRPLANEVEWIIALGRGGGGIVFL
jgi:hypothetical protein